jgi:hypothetical protein
MLGGSSGGVGRLSCDNDYSHNVDDADAVLALLAFCTICGARRGGRHLGLGSLERSGRRCHR